jgi:hypothetical protein
VWFFSQPNFGYGLRFFVATENAYFPLDGSGRSGGSRVMEKFHLCLGASTEKNTTSINVCSFGWWLMAGADLL